ncbi:MAG TPA: VanZ family protein [Verrucomicrobiae bacterium]|nr:VanZ family protein [Verrucomicrobiae bacterium]
MPGSKSLLKYWLPVLVWMALIFWASTDLMSSQRTSRIIGPLLRWFNPDLSEETIRHVQLVVRKTAHLTEYAILALLLWRAIRKPKKEDGRPWSWREAALAIAVAGAYAMTDELHQHFVASRYGSAWDVLLDTLGAAAGMFVLWALGRWRRLW